MYINVSDNVVTSIIRHSELSCVTLVSMNNHTYVGLLLHFMDVFLEQPDIIRENRIPDRISSIFQPRMEPFGVFRLLVECIDTRVCYIPSGERPKVAQPAMSNAE